jgi:hypothetical protein
VIPTYRGSQLDAFATCPFAFGCNLKRAAYKATTTEAETEAYLSAYCCPEGVQYIMENCGTAPMPLMSRMTQIGTQFHAFAFAYGTHLKREKLATDWEEADRIARGLATVDGSFVKGLYDTCVYWYQQFEHQVPTLSQGDVDLCSGSFEQGRQAAFNVGDRECLYVMHPDFAKLSPDLTYLTIMDWKSGLRCETYDPDYPNKQLLRYAWAFAKLFPTIREVELHLVFTNPKHPLSEEPLVWVRDLQELAISDEIVTAPVSAIAASPEFKPAVGCWLCDGYCEWALYCDEADAVAHIMDVKPETALEAYQLREESYSVSKKLSAKRAQLKRIVDAHVAQNGPLAVGLSEDGEPLLYGPRKVVSAEVSDMAALVEELVEMQRPDLIRKLKLEGAREFAEEAGMVKPFGESALKSVKFGWRVGNSAVGAEDDDDVDASGETAKQIATAAPRRTLAADAVETAAPPAASEFAGAF